MLTQEKILENKETYIKFLSKLGLDLHELYKYLDGHNYFDQPYSSQGFNAFNGGLVDYQIKLCIILKNLCNIFTPNKYSDEDIIKVALFKDFYRGFMYETGVGRYNDKGEVVPTFKTLNAEARPVYGDLGLSSYMLAKNFISFTDEQALTIIHAKSDGYTPDIYQVLKDYSLVTLLKMADLAVQNLDITISED